MTNGITTVTYSVGNGNPGTGPNQGQLTVTCGSGKVALTGGVFCEGGTARALQGSAPTISSANGAQQFMPVATNGTTAPTGWTGKCNADAGRVTVYAVCMPTN